MPTRNPAVVTFPRDAPPEATFERAFESSGPTANETAKRALSSNLARTDATSPDVVLVFDDPIHLWFGGTHLVETADRRATENKYYLMVTGASMLYRVADVSETDPESAEYAVSEDARELLDGAADELLLEPCYALGEDAGPYEDQTETLPRAMFERDGSLTSYVDPPPIPFVPADR